MRIKHKVRPQLFDDVDAKDALFSLDDTKSEVVIDSYLRQASGRFSVAAASTEALSLGDVNVPRGFYIEVDNDCDLSISGGAAIPLRRSSTITGTKAKVFLECALSALSITTGAGVVVTGKYCVWGDPSA